MTDNPLDGIELLKSLTDLAEALRHYYRALVAEGFTADQALQLTLAYQTQLLRRPAPE